MSGWIKKGCEKNREWRPVAVRRMGRLRLIWEDDIRTDPGKMKAQNWSKMAIRIVVRAKYRRIVVPREEEGAF